MKTNTGVGIALLFAGCGMVACSAQSDDASTSTEDLDSGYLTGLTAINEQNSVNATILLDGKSGAGLAQWAPSNVYDSADFPMRAVIDLGRVYDVTDIQLFHGNGQGQIGVKALPVGADVTKDSSFLLVENHTASLWNAWEPVKEARTPRTQYLELTIATRELFTNYSEIRVKGTAVGAVVDAGAPKPDAGSPPVGSACTVSVGSGSGSITLTPANAPSGSVVCIKGGTYSGGSFSKLSNVKILPAAPVTFTGGIGIQNNLNVTFDGSLLSGITYGYTFTGSGTAFTPGDSSTTANNQNLTIRGAQFEGVTVVDGSGEHITYNGTPATTLFSNLVIDKIKVSGAAMIYNGTWAGPALYQNVVMGISLTNVVLLNDPNAGPTKVFGNSLYHLVADHWNVSGETLFAGQPDTGIFHMVGNATIRNMVRNGGYGYVARLWNVSLGASADSYFYNIIDVNTQEYGTVDVRIDPVQFNGQSAALPLVGNNVHIFNVTAGNKKSRVNADGSPYYRTPLAIIGAFTDGVKTYSVELRNCFAFNNEQRQDNGGSLVRVYSPSQIVYSASNNVTVEGPLPAGYLVDQTTFHPLVGGPLVGKGLTIPLTALDVYGHSRGTSFDIGAAQH